MSQKASIIEALPDDLRSTIEQDVQAGDFANADDAIRQAIISQHERIAIRRSLVEAEKQIDRGEGIPGEQVFDDLRRRSQELRSKA